MTATGDVSATASDNPISPVVASIHLMPTRFIVLDRLEINVSYIYREFNI
jgi:hypothetical protein